MSYLKKKNPWKIWKQGAGLLSMQLFLSLGVIAQTPVFTDVQDGYWRTQKNLRKWDAPVVADLDQDGYPDLVLNDHGFGVRICWNNAGRFSKPYDLIMGDLHGISIGDFNRDGDIDLVLSRGGGSGSNARNSKLYSVNKRREFRALPDFLTPLAMMRGRTVVFYDGDQDGDLDLLNFAFPSREKKGISENYIYENDGAGQLTVTSLLPPIKGDGQKTLLTDFNGDAIFDILLYGSGTVQLYQGGEAFTYTEVSSDVFPFPIADISNAIEFDFDNDGDIDLFFTRGDNFEKGEFFYDNISERLGFFTKRGKFSFDNIKTGDVLQFENYHTQWPQTNQLYIGETGYLYEHPGENHSGKDLRLINSNALGFPDRLSKKGIYVGYVGNENWRIAGEIGGPLTGVIYGVKKYAEYEHPPAPEVLLLENENGKFTDATREKGLLLSDFCSSAAAADLDNNGYLDLIIVRRGDLIHDNEAVVFLNKGTSGFQRLHNHQIISKEPGAIGMGIATFDYNKDGLTDVVIGNERGKWHLFRNTLPKGAATKYITVDVGDAPSGNATALGALVTLYSCTGQQQRRVGAGSANYSLSFDSSVHFGIGPCDKPLEIVIQWTTGETKRFTP